MSPSLLSLSVLRTFSVCGWGSEISKISFVHLNCLLSMHRGVGSSIFDVARCLRGAVTAQSGIHRFGGQPLPLHPWRSTFDVTFAVLTVVYCWLSCFYIGYV